MTDFYGLNLKNLLEKAHVGVVVHRWDTSIVYANPTALKLLDVSFEDMKLKKLSSKFSHLFSTTRQTKPD